MPLAVVILLAWVVVAAFVVAACRAAAQEDLRELDDPGRR